MKWRCTWCGKPHESNDPPCDSCGHNVFEEAVVRADESDDSTVDSTVDELQDIDPETGTVETGTTYVWRCQDCGRDHVKFNPPCSRCGNHDLEKTEQHYDDVEHDLDTPSWLEVAKPYLPVFAVVGIVFALFATGIVSPSIIPGLGPPSAPDAPGDDAAAAGLEFETVETEVYAQLEAERSEPRTADAGLADFAEYFNRLNVAAEYGTADQQPELVEPADFGVSCTAEPSGGPLSLENHDPTAYDDEADLADAIATAILEAYDDETTSGAELEGLDIHETPEESLSVFYATC